MVHEDFANYYRFTGPQRLDKAIHTLEGLLNGIAADGQVSIEEAEQVRRWLDEHNEFASHHPFNEIVPVLDDALADGRIDEEESEDLLWLCRQFTSDEGFFATVTSDMQRLQGLLAGIASDGQITKNELENLQGWMSEHEHLKQVWPFAEIESLLMEVLRDGRIDADEHDLLLHFFTDFLSYAGHRALALPLNEVNTPITGLCAVCPEIDLEDRLFCFTGKSERASRRELAKLIEKRGGRFSTSVRKDLDYLIIGADGNPCWAFSCYGRKVEQAVAYRKQGVKLLLVHEFDFWDAVEDAHLS